MPLVVRIALGMGAVLALCTGAGSILIHEIVTARFEDTETQLVLRNRAVVAGAVEREVSFLRLTVNDWSHWDDLHDFAAGRNPGFAAGELGGRGIQRLGLDALLVLDPAGRTLNADFSAAALAAAAAPAATIARVVESLRGLDPAGNSRLPDQPVAGLLDTPAGTLALAAQPVLRTDGTGAPAGFLVMARRLDPGRITSELSVLPAEVRLYNSSNIPPDLHRMAIELGGTGATARLVPRDDDLSDFQFYRDLNGRPAFLLESRMARSIAGAGREATSLIAVVTFGAALLALATLVVVLRQMVTQPVARLTRHMLAMQDADTEVPVPGLEQEDEIGTLAQEFDALIRARRADVSALRRLAAAVRNAGDAIAILDQVGRIVYVNPQFERQTGTTAAEVLDRRPSRGLSPPEVYADLWETVDRGEEWQGLLLSRRPDGSVLEEEVTVAPIRDARDDISGYVAVMRDVTASRQAQAELRKLAAAVASAAEAIVVLDRQGRIEYCNPAYERLRQLPAAELLGRHPAEVGRGLDTLEHYAAIWEAVRRGEVWSGEIHSARLDGREQVEEVVMSPIRDRTGLVTHYVAVLHDVTGRRELEVELAQARHVEAVGQLAARVAQEINSPIQYVGANLRFLQESYGSIAGLLDALAALARRTDGAPVPARDLAGVIAAVDMEYLRREMPSAIAQSLEGVDQVTEIVRSMKELSGATGRRSPSPPPESPAAVGAMASRVAPPEPRPVHGEESG